MSKKIADRLDRIEELLIDIAKLLKDSANSDSGNIEPYPYPIPTVPARPITPPTLQPVTCSRCGIELNNVMGYVCQDPTCPTGLGPIMCVVE